MTELEAKRRAIVKRLAKIEKEQFDLRFYLHKYFSVLLKSEKDIN
jgi:hypothetical protein